MFEARRQERVWREFMDESKSKEELYQLLNDSTLEDFFRDRAIKIFMTYDFASLPFKVNLTIGTKNMLWLVDFSEFPEDKIDEAAIVLARNIREIKCSKNHIDAREKYNQLILDLLPRLDLSRKQELFEYFDIRQIACFSGMDECSGYGPLGNLIYKKNIDDCFRNLAIEKMHKVILSEFKKESAPRQDFEDAFISYRSILNFYLENPEIDQTFFEKEIAFLLSIDNGEAVSEYNLPKMLPKIFNKETRRALVKRQLNCNGHYQFYIHGSETELLAERIRDEFPEFADKIVALQKTYYERQEQEKEVNREMLKKKKSMFDNMKKSQN